MYKLERKVQHLPDKGWRLPQSVNSLEKLEFSASTMAFISCRMEVRVRLTDAARQGRVERGCECGGKKWVSSLNPNFHSSHHPIYWYLPASLHSILQMMETCWLKAPVSEAYCHSVEKSKPLLGRFHTFLSYLSTYFVILPFQVFLLTLWFYYKFTYFSIITLRVYLRNLLMMKQSPFCYNCITSTNKITVNNYFTVSYTGYTATHYSLTVLVISLPILHLIIY